MYIYTYIRIHKNYLCILWLYIFILKYLYACTSLIPVAYIDIVKKQYSINLLMLTYNFFNAIINIESRRGIE